MVEESISFTKRYALQK